MKAPRFKLYAGTAKLIEVALPVTLMFFSSTNFQLELNCQRWSGMKDILTFMKVETP